MKPLWISTAYDIDGALLADLEGWGGNISEILDAKDANAIAAFGAEHGAMDVLFNCAGYVHQGGILDCSERVEAW